MHTNAQIFLDHFTAAATPLTGVAGIDLPCTAPSIFSFVRSVFNKLTPSRIGDGLRQTVILEHSANVQIFKNDDSVFVDQLTAFLMSKVSAQVCYALVNKSHYLAAILSF